MANTESNLTGSIERIHADIPLPVLQEGLSLNLSSHEHALARIDIENARITRTLGRRVLEFDLVDGSGIAEIHDQKAARQSMRLHLGRSAVIGRGNPHLPILDSTVISEPEHLVLSYVQIEGKDRLSIHDNSSLNGSHLTTTAESTWSEKIKELSQESDAPQHYDDNVDVTSYDWLFSDTYERYPAVAPKTTL